MNLVWSDRVAVQIADWLDLISFAVEFDFIGFHHFLNGGANITETNINTGCPNTSVGCILDSLQQLIINRIERKRESTINNSAVDMGTKIDFANIILHENGLIT